MAPPVSRDSIFYLQDKDIPTREKLLQEETTSVKWNGKDEMGGPRFFDLPDGAGADERRAESNPAETSEFSGDSGGRRRRMAGHGVILLLMAFGQRQDDLLFFQIGSVRAEALTTQMEAITADGH